MPVTVMRRSSSFFPVTAAFLILVLAAASPLQRSHVTALDESLASPSGWNPLLLQREPEPSLQEKSLSFNFTHLSSAFNSACGQ